MLWRRSFIKSKASSGDFGHSSSCRLRRESVSIPPTPSQSASTPNRRAVRLSGTGLMTLECAQIAAMDDPAPKHGRAAVQRRRSLTMPSKMTTSAVDCASSHIRPPVAASAKILVRVKVGDYAQWRAPSFHRGRRYRGCVFSQDRPERFIQSSTRRRFLETVNQ